MTGTSDPWETSPSTGGFTVFAVTLRPELSRVAYLLTGHHATAEDAVAGALREAARVWVGPGPDAVDQCRIAVVRQALVLAEHLDRSQDDDFWRGGAWALQRLPTDQRLLVALAVEAGLEEAELARLLGVSQRIVRRRLAAGCAALGRHLKLPVDGDRQPVLQAVQTIARTHRVGAMTSMPVRLTDPVDGFDDVDDLDDVDGGALVRRAAALPVQGRPMGARLAVAVLVLIVVAAGSGLYWLLRPETGGDVTLSTTSPTVSSPAEADAAAPPVTPLAASGPTSSPPPSTATTTTTTTTTTTVLTTPTAPTRSPRRSSAPARDADRTVDPSPRTSTTRPPTRRPTTRTSTPYRLPAGLFVGQDSQRCLDLAPGVPWGTSVRLAECVGGGSQIVTDGPGGSLLIGGLCLDDNGWSRSPGALVVGWECTSQVNQQWTIGADGTIRSVFVPGLCLATEGGARSVGTRIVLDACSSAANQVWRRT